MDVTCKQAALTYLHQYSWSVIPLRPRDKRPLASWLPYQTQRASAESVCSWFQTYPDSNVGIVTGAVSGLVVLDLDGEEGRAAVQGRELPVTPVAQTGGGGLHYLFRHPGVPVRNQAGILPHVDVRGDGGYVVAPPSVHQSGRRYRWLIAPDETPLAPIPGWLLPKGGTARSAQGRSGVDRWEDFLRTQVPEGRRNQTLTRIAGHLLRHSGLSARESFELGYAWAQVYCTPPLARDEVARIFNSIATREASRRMRRELDG